MSFESFGNYGQAPLAGPSISDQKKQQVAQATQQKQAELDPQAAYNKDLTTLDPYQLQQKHGQQAVVDQLNYKLGERQGQRIDSMPRSAGDVAGDLGTSVEKGAVGLAGGLYSGILAGAGGLANLGQQFGTDEQKDFFRGQETEIAQHNAGYSSLVNRLNDKLENQLSTKSQLVNQRMGMVMDEHQKENQAQHDADVKAGRGDFMAGLAQIGRGVVQGGADVLSDPTYAGNFIAEQVPSLALGPLSKAAATRSVTAGLSKAEAKSLLMTDAGKAAVEKAGTKNLMAAIGVTEGTGAGQQTFDQVMGMTPDDLQKNSPEYRDMVANGYTPKDAQAVLAQRASGIATAVQAPLAAATGRIAAKFELSPLSGGGATGAARVTHALSSMGKETVEEALQSGSGQAAQNAGVKATADETQSLTDGVGEQAGMGAIGAVGLTAAAQAPSAVGGVAAVTARQTAAIAKQGANLTMDKLRTIAESRTALSEEDQAQASEQAKNDSIEQAAQEYAKAQPQAATDAQAGESPAAADVEDSRIGKLMKVNTLLSAPDAPEPLKRKVVAQGFAAMQNMVEEYRAMAAGVEANPDADHSVTQAKMDAMTKAFASPEFANIVAHQQHYAANPVDVSAAEQAIPDTVETATPEMQQHAADVAAQAAIAPEKVPAPLYQKVLANSQQLGLSPQQVAQVQGGQKLAQLAQVKGMDIVNRDVTEGGSQEFRSLKEHVKGVYAGLAANDTQMAQSALDGLQAFAAHMSNKAADFDGAMQKWQASDRSVPLTVTRYDGSPYNSLVATGSASQAKPMFASGKSAKLIPQIHSEAALLADTFNQILTDHPELSGKPINVAPLQFNAQAPAAVPLAAKAPAPRESVASGLFIGERELTRPEAQDLINGEVTRADLQAKWAEETAPAQETAPAAPESTTAPEVEQPQQEAAAPQESAPVQSDALPVDTDPLVGENITEPAPKADPVTANPEPVTPPTETSQEPQNGTTESPEPVADNPVAATPVAPEETPQTGAERLLANLTPRLNRERKDTESEADHEARVSNAVVKWFEPAKARTPFTRTADFMAKLGTAVVTSAEATAELLGLKEGEQLSQDNLNALDTLVALNGRFRNVYAEAINAKLTRVKDLNALPWRNIPILYFSRVIERGDTRVTQTSSHATDAIGMATMKFALDNLRATAPVTRDELAKDLSVTPDQVTPEMMEKFGTGSQAFLVVAQRLAGTIARTMGLKAVAGAPGNIANGIPLSLAMDALNVMEKMGLAKIDTLSLSVPTSDGVDTRTLKSVRFINAEGEALDEIDRALGNQLDVLSRMLDPDSKASAYIDEVPPVGADRLGRSQVQKLSRRLKDTVRNLQKKPFYLNTDLHDLVEGMGEPAIRRMLGEQPLDGLNKVHAESVKGKNTSINSAITAWRRGMQDLQAKAGDRELASIPVHFAWNIASNMRAMLSSSTFNPQMHKMHRELMTGEPAQINTKNTRLMRQFNLSVAQSLGVKVDRVSNEEAKKKLAEKLADPAIRNAIDVMKAHLGDFSNLQAADVQAIIDGVNVGGEGMKSFHGLLTMAKREHAKDNGYTAFTSHLTYELDGKTDGPANALVHFGSVSGDSKFLDLLGKVGLFVNDNKTALNVFSAGAQDIYQTVSGNINSQLKSWRPDPTKHADKALASMKAQGLLLQLSGNIEMTNPDDIRTFTATRNMAKNPVTQTVYSAGDNAKVHSLSTQIQDAVYEALSQAIQQGTELDSNILDAVTALTGATELRDPANYQSFAFRPSHAERLEGELKTGMGAVLNAAIDSVLGNVVTSGQTIAAAANAQHALFIRAFKDARQTKLDALREAGERSTFDDLSNDEVQAVYDSVSHLAPVYHNALTNGTSPREGMMMSDEARGNFTGQRAESVFGDKTDIPALTWTAPGARPAPMMTISSGDATMMALYFLEHSNALNVFDGLEVMPGQFDQASAAINKAVFQGWQFSLMQGIADGFDAGTKAFDNGLLSKLTDEDLVTMAREMRVPAKFLKGATREAVMNEIHGAIANSGIQLRNLATSIEAVKSVIFNEMPTSTDHMAGNEKPVVNRADIDPVADPVSHIAYRVEKFNERHQKAEDLQMSQTDAALDRHLKAVNPGKGDAVTQFTKEQVLTALKGYLDEVAGKKSRIPQFVLNQIAQQLPDDTTVHIGTERNIRQHILEQFPDIGEENIKLLQGMTWGNQVFIGNRSAETILHELVHVATQRAIDQYFTDKAQLSEEQQKSVTALNAIMTDFLSEEAAGMSDEQRRFKRSTNVQQYLQSLVATDDRITALKEFVAWSLTNPWLARDLEATENKDKSTHILGRVLKAIARLLGIGTGAQSYFASIAGHAQALMGYGASRDVTGPVARLNQLDVGALFDRLRSERTSTNHQTHLDQVFASMKQNLLDRINATQQPVAGIKTAADQLDLDSIDPQISLTAAQFMANGFAMNAQEEMVFKMLQAGLQTAFETQAAKAIEARRLFNEAGNRLTPADFVDATGSLVMAEQRYNALFGAGQNSDAQLANFMAVAQVNAPLRNALRQMFVKRESQRAQNWEQRITKSVDDALRWTANLGTGIRRTREVQKRLDILTKNLTHFEAQARQNVIEKATSGIGDSLDQLNNYVNQKKATGAKWVEANATTLSQKVPNATARHYVEFALRGAAAMGDKGASGRLAESVLSVLNQGNANEAMGPLRALMVEIIGTTDSNRAIHNLVTKGKTSVDKIRQLLREQVPALVNSRFSAPMSEAESAALHTGLGKTDAASLLNGGYTVADVQKLYSDSAYLQQEIAAARTAVTGPHAAMQRDAADALAHFMVTGEVTTQHLLSNAFQIANMSGTGFKVEARAAKAQVPVIDKLTSLLAIQKVPAQQAQAVATTMARELAANPDDNGATFVMNYLNNLRRREESRLDAYNTIKGAMHTTFDAHKSVVIANPRDGAELIRRGYVKGALVQGDPSSNHGLLHYYESTEGGRPQWNQGAMQTVQVTAGGVDPYTGRMRTPIRAPSIAGDAVRSQQLKRRGAIVSGQAFKPNGSNMNMRPVFNIQGGISGYEYSVPHAVRDTKLDANNDIAHNLGVWEGRIREEELSQAFNQALVTQLHNRYTEDMKTVGRENEYVEITHATQDPQVKEMWTLMPVEMREMVKETFGGNLRVRKDMLDNAMGFRRSSVKELWDGDSRLPEGVQDAVRAVAAVTMGNKAARYMRKGERILQEAVSSAKDWIVVRSLVVARDNIISNITQMVTHGMSPLQVARKSAEAMVLVDAYQKNERRLNELSLLLQNQADASRHKAYSRELESLRAENARSPVHPLVLAGHLPTIAEGLSENDDYSLRNDMTGWLENITSKIPKEVKTATRYALIARGTPLYAGLNRMIQYGDFTAKYALYDHLQNRKTDKMSQQDALTLLEDEFVNYSLLPSRSRDYLESIGATWFLNYKLRIQKVLLRSLRDNPLRFLALAGGAQAMGIPGVLESNLVTNTLRPNLGWGALFRAHETHPLWWLMD